MNKKLMSCLVASLFVAGCATNEEYFRAVDIANQRSAEIAQTQALVQQERINALSQLAQSDDVSTRTAAAMAIAFMDTETNQQVIVPQRPENQVLQWASVLAAPVTTLGAAAINANVSRRQIAANRDIAISTNDAFIRMNENAIEGVSQTGQAGSAALADISRTSIQTIGSLAGDSDDD